MRFHSVATPHPNSNAVGPLQLRCSPQELIIDHVSVRRRVAGGPLGPVTIGTQSRIPWAEVRAELLGADQLFIDLGPHRTPLNRFCLTRFSTSDDQAATAPSSRRGLWWLATLCFGVLVAVSALGYWLPSASEHLGALISAAFASATVLLLLLVGVASGHRWTVHRGSSNNALTHLLVQLNESLPRGVEGSNVKLLPSVELATPSRWGGRPGAGWAIAGAVAATTLTAWLTWSENPSEPGLARSEAQIPSTPGVDPSSKVPPIKDSAALSHQGTPTEREQHSLRPALPNSPQKTPKQEPAAQPGSVNAQALTLGAPCQCVRPDSPLWKVPVPRLSSLVLSRKTTTVRGHQQTRVEIAIVNNSDRPLRDLAVAVEFEAPPTRTSNLPPKVIRHLFYDGPLGPGRAVKWTAEGPGKNFTLTSPTLAPLLRDGSDTAPAEKFVTLTDANSRSVRLHAARMLAYLGDPQAKKATEMLLRANQLAEADYLRRILEATSPLFSCELESPEDNAPSLALNTCIFNRSLNEANSLTLRVHSLNGPVRANEPTASFPAMVENLSWPLLGTLGPATGRRVSLPSAFLQADQSLHQYVETTVTLGPSR